MSLRGYGVIVEGLAALHQAIDVIIRTSKGSDPLRPEFGSNVYKYADAPLPIAIPNIKREILAALEIWEKRVKVIGINHFIKAPGNPVFEITYGLVDEDTIETILFDLQNGVTPDGPAEITLQAFFPVNANNYRYQIKLTKNNKPGAPIPPIDGFPTIQEMFSWVLTNWAFYGRWFLLNDRIVCYMPAAGVTSASLEIVTLPSVVRFSAPFPLLQAGWKFAVSFLANGVNAVPAMPQTFNTVGAVLSWAKQNWAGYASWYIEYKLNDNTVFTDEFSDEFDIPTTGYTLVGVSYIGGFTGELSINPIV